MQIDVGFFKDVSSQKSGLILWATLYIVLRVYSSFVLVKLLLFLQNVVDELYSWSGQSLYTELWLVEKLTVILWFEIFRVALTRSFSHVP